MNSAKDDDDSQFQNTISIIDSILNEAKNTRYCLYVLYSRFQSSSICDKLMMSEFWIRFICSTQKILYVDHGCNEIKIEPPNDVDSHFIILKLDKDLMATVSAHSLPNIPKLFKPFGTIETYATMFFSYLEQMELFYSYMSSIDELCYVIDPTKNDTKCNHRLIKIGKRNRISKRKL